MQCLFKLQIESGLQFPNLFFSQKQKGVLWPPVRLPFGVCPHVCPHVCLVTNIAPVAHI